MKVEVKYEKTDIERLVLEVHEKRFGQLPAGEMWMCGERYGTYVVENVEIETKPEPAVEKAVTL